MDPAGAVKAGRLTCLNAVAEALSEVLDAFHVRNYGLTRLFPAP